MDQLLLGERIDIRESRAGSAWGRRGNLVFWQSHVGMMLGGARLAHANAYHRSVEVEPLARAVKRIRASGDGVPIA
ncbi:MAG TPA: hypothetical protein VII63_12200 [Caulobacteraceae bacterium]